MQCIKLYITLSTEYSAIKLHTVQLIGSAQCNKAGVTCHCYSPLFAIVVGFHTPSLVGSVMNQNSSWLMSCILTCSPFACNGLDSAKVYMNIVWIYAYHKDIPHPLYTTGCEQCHQAGVTCTYLQCSVLHCGRLLHTVSRWQCHQSELIMTHALHLDMLPNRMQWAGFCKVVYISEVYCSSTDHTNITHPLWNWVVYSATKQESHVFAYSALFSGSIVVGFYTLSLAGSVTNQNWPWYTFITFDMLPKCSLPSGRRILHCCFISVSPKVPLSKMENADISYMRIGWVMSSCFPPFWSSSISVSQSTDGSVNAVAASASMDRGRPRYI